MYQWKQPMTAKIIYIKYILFARHLYTQIDVEFSGATETHNVFAMRFDSFVMWSDAPGVYRRSFLFIYIMIAIVANGVVLLSFFREFHVVVSRTHTRRLEDETKHKKKKSHTLRNGCVALCWSVKQSTDSNQSIRNIISWCDALIRTHTTELR